MRALTAWTVAALGAWVAAQQSGRRCTLEIVTAPGTRSHYTQVAPGVAKLDVGGGLEATCGDAWMRADSASYHQGTEVLWLIGRVDYRDSTRTLQADRVTYDSKEERMVAEGSVRLTARATGSTLTGPVVHYRPATERRPYDRIFAPRRSQLAIYPEREAEDRRPMNVEGDRIYILGDSVIAAAGTATAKRPDFDAAADSMHLDLPLEVIWLLGSPRVVAEATTLEGDTLRGELRERQIERVEAWPNGRARSEDYALRADSLDTRMPGQQVRQVIAVGSAFAEAFTELAARDPATPIDWVSGDTIVAIFEPKAAATAAADGRNGPAAEAVELKTLVATGDARAFYHVRDRSRPDRPPSVNYVLGRRVTVQLVGGEVQDAKVDGPSVGVYLEPRETPPDTTAADTTAPPRPGATPRRPGGAGPSPKARG